MISVLSFLVPDAIVSTKSEMTFIETVERIDSAIARAIAGKANNERSAVLPDFSFLIARYNSDIIGK